MKDSTKSIIVNGGAVTAGAASVAAGVFNIMGGKQTPMVKKIVGYSAIVGGAAVAAYGTKGIIGAVKANKKLETN